MKPEVDIWEYYLGLRGPVNNEPSFPRVPESVTDFAFLSNINRNTFSSKNKVGFFCCFCLKFHPWRRARSVTEDTSKWISKPLRRLVFQFTKSITGKTACRLVVWIRSVWKHFSPSLNTSFNDNVFNILHKHKSCPERARGRTLLKWWVVKSIL